MPSSSRHGLPASVGWLLFCLASPALTHSAKPAQPIGDEAYDRVGYAAMREGAVPIAGVTAAHVSLPLGSYVEVTALATGRTILVSIDQRATAGGALILLSPDAAAQLGLAGTGAVRIRRVNPSAQEEAILRTGGRAPSRLDAPPALLTALRKQLGEAAAVQNSRGPTGAEPAGKPSSPRKPAPAVVEAPSARPKAPLPIGKTGRYVVQIAALTVESRATALARTLDGHVASGGGFWRVRLGPYASRSEAQSALSRLAGKGFENARIMVIDAR